MGKSPKAIQYSQLRPLFLLFIFLIVLCASTFHRTAIGHGKNTISIASTNISCLSEHFSHGAEQIRWYWNYFMMGIEPKLDPKDTTSSISSITVDSEDVGSKPDRLSKLRNRKGFLSWWIKLSNWYYDSLRGIILKWKGRWIESASRRHPYPRRYPVKKHEMHSTALARRSGVIENDDNGRNNKNGVSIGAHSSNYRVQIANGNVDCTNERIAHACNLLLTQGDADDEVNDDIVGDDDFEDDIVGDDYVVDDDSNIKAISSTIISDGVNTVNHLCPIPKMYDGQYGTSPLSIGDETSDWNPTSKPADPTKQQLLFRKAHDPFPGMVLNVFPKGRDIDDSKGIFCNDAATTATTTTSASDDYSFLSKALPGKTTSPITKIPANTNHHYIDKDNVDERKNAKGKNDNFIVNIYQRPCSLNTSRGGSQRVDVMYELREQIQGELGLYDVHNLDYAYSPVKVIIAADPAGGSSKAGNTSPSSTTFGHSSHLWERPIEGIDGGKDRSGPSNRGHRMGNQFYERLGDHAFAGGSHGRVWRARKRCNPLVTPKEEQVTSNIQQIRRQQRHRKQQREERNTRRSSAWPKTSPMSETCDDQEEFIMKQMKVHDRIYLLEAGLREVYFGEILLAHCNEASSLFTEYMDHFFHKPSDDAEIELWIVFKYAGSSLRSYIYTPITSSGFVVYQHSPIWIRMRMGKEWTETTDGNPSSVAVISKKQQQQQQQQGDEDVPPAESVGTRKQQQREERSSNKMGKILLRKILRQLLRSAAKLHERGIVHRDIKPSNIMCKPGFDINNIRSWNETVLDITCVLGDFSSAIDDFSSDNFYSSGPSPDEQSTDYAPPEVLFGPKWIPFFESKPETYDSWSIGVVILELLLGTPNVFSVDQRTTAVLCNKMNKEGATPKDIERALFLAALSQFCIYTPMSESGEKIWPLREGDPLFNVSIVKNTCTLADFHMALRARDPLGIGFDSSYDTLLQLIWGLLSWDPRNRLTASDALNHVYFIVATYSDQSHNALESQIIDPRLDINVGERVIRDFTCPKCGRIFSDLQSCQKHVTGRRHGKFCSYDGSSLPTCLNAHSMLPAHPTSGYCDIQGRRRTIEDFHAIHLHEHHQFFGVFDGHNGNLASKYASSSLYHLLARRLEDIDDDIVNGSDWKIDVTNKMIDSFQELHQGVLKATSSYPGVVMSKSGTTVTALFMTEKAIIVANVGDSRAILSVGASFNTSEQAYPIQLTVDHIASDAEEKKRVESLGGFISSRGGVPRVNGTLVLSRSIGDAHLKQFLSQTPHVIAMTKDEMRSKCQKVQKNPIAADSLSSMPCFIVLASDGLWDVMSNQEAVDMVEFVIQKYDPNKENGWKEGVAFQEAAEMLTKEAYVRGSTDNIGVCVVAIE